MKNKQGKKQNKFALAKRLEKQRMLQNNRLMLTIEQDGKCHYCHKPMDKITVDHKKPKSKGGHSSMNNLVACCVKCNKRKGSKPYEQFIREMSDAKAPANTQATMEE
jgi:5-methylcytosine-specific restriction endonuclease McrA